MGLECDARVGDFQAPTVAAMKDRPQGFGFRVQGLGVWGFCGSGISGLRGLG